MNPPIRQKDSYKSANKGIAEISSSLNLNINLFKSYRKFVSVVNTFVEILSHLSNPKIDCSHFYKIKKEVGLMAVRITIMHGYWL